MISCPECGIKFQVFGDSTQNLIHPGKVKEEDPDCPVMYYNKKEGRVWYVPKHEPRFKEMKLE